MLQTATRRTTGEHETNELVLTNLPLVEYAVRELMSRVPGHVNRDDLMSAGRYALVKAARGYNPAIGVPFISYAKLRIRGELIDELRGMDWVPRTVRTLSNLVTEKQAEMTGKLGRTPSADEVAAAMDVRPDQVQDARDAATSRILSLDAFEHDHRENLVVDDNLSPEARAVAKERRAYLIAGVQVLPAKLRVVIEGTFFTDREDADMAAEYGVSRSRISQMRTEALIMIREGMYASLDPDLMTPAEAPNGIADRRQQAYHASLASRAALNALPTQRTSTSVPAATKTPLRLVDTAA